MQQIADGLESLGMSEYARGFAENGINVAALLHLTDQDLKDIGVLLGHRSSRDHLWDHRLPISGINGVYAVVPVKFGEGLCGP